MATNLAPQQQTPQTGPSYTNGSEYTSSPTGKQSISDFLQNTKNLMSKLRSRNIPSGAEPPSADGATARFAPSNSAIGSDWRVKLSVPDLSTFRSSPILEPLTYTNNCLVFPLTPSITLAHNANYDSFDPTHANYSFPQYVSSRVEDITVAGEFIVENEDDARYWMAAVHFLRSMTKMFYGETSNKGAPPPVVKLNGYGDFVFNNVPVVVKSFTNELPNQVDYIRTKIFVRDETGSLESRYQMVPTLSTLTVVLGTAYSRSKIETFSLDRYINGDLIDKGFI